MFKTLVDKYANVVEIVKEYQLSGNYRDIQLCVSYTREKEQDYLAFVLSTFPVLAARQEGSTFICVPLQLAFKTMLVDVYGVRENRCYFFYDMLTVEERYNIAIALAKFGNTYTEIKLLHYQNGSYYSLNFDRGCIYLFSTETEIKLEDTATGNIRELDLIDGLGWYKFNIAFLRPKS